MSSKFFYIITRDSQIIEVKYDEKVLVGVASAMKEKGLVTLKDYGAILNGVDISKILSESQYDNYISTVKPKEYIRNGAWRDIKDHGVIRYEKWKEDQMNETKRIEAEVKPEDREKVKSFLKKYRPDFTKM